MEGALGELISRFATDGQVKWIGVRTERRGAIKTLDRVDIELAGLVGDRRESPGKRAITLIQAEHLPVISALANKPDVDPALLRRNLVVNGINLLGLRKAQFRVGDALLQGTGPCAPCSRMEEVLGTGGYTAMRGHGGITAMVLEPGAARIGDPVEFVSLK